MVTFYVVRHGEKEFVPFDPGLTGRGKRQAELTAGYFKDVEFVAIHASPKTRTRQTAEIIAGQGREIVVDPRLIERLEWEPDRSFEEFMAEWDKTDLDRTYKASKGSSSFDNGLRMRALLEDLSKRYRNGNVILVTHGGTIGDMLRNLFSEDVLEHVVNPENGARHIEIGECSITRIEKSEDGFRLVGVGDVGHLET